MLYSNYKKRLERIAKVIDFIKKYKVLILSCIGTLLALLIAFIAVRGMITAPLEISASEIIYGEEVSCEAGALFRGVNFEHKLENGDEWKEGLPEKVGVYSVRGYARRAFGQKSYTEELTLEIKPKKVQISVESLPISYGEEPKVIGQINDGDIILQDQMTLIYEQTVGRVNFKIDKQSVIIANSDGEDVTNCYDIITVDNVVTVATKQVTLTVDAADKVYDGVPLTCDKYEILGLVFNDYLDINFTKELTDVGSVKNSPDYRILNNDGEDVTSCYKVQENIGNLTVSKRPISFKVKDRQSVYDATEQTCQEYEIKNGELAEGHSVKEFTFNNGKTDVGSIDVEFASLIIFDNGNKDVTNNYQLTLEKGTIEILHREITVAVEGQKVYDGLVLGLSSYIDSTGISFVNGSLAREHVLKVLTIKEDACEFLEYNEENIHYSIMQNGDTDVKSNYKVTFDSVSMVIDKRPVVFTAGSDQKIYDSEPLVFDFYSVENLVDGHVEDVVVSGTITDVGRTDNIVECNFIKNGNVDVTHNYQITCNKGQLDVTPREVYVWAEIKKVYDDTTDISEDAIIDLFVQKIENNGTRTVGLYGEQELTADFESNVSFTDVESYIDGARIKKDTLKIINGRLENYFFIELASKLIITPRPLTVRTGTGTRVYNAEEQTYEVYSVEGLVEWHDISFKDWLALTNVSAPLENTVLVDKIVDSRDILDIETGNYDVEYVCGTFNIMPRVLKGAMYSTDNIYNDQIFKGIGRNEHIINAGSKENKLVSGHYINIETVSENAGEYTLKNNKLLYAIKYDNGGVEEDVTYNYDLSEFDIQVIIEKRPIVLNAPDVQKTYDGKEYAEKQVIEVTGIVLGHNATAIIRGASKNAIPKENNPTLVDVGSLVIKRGDGTNVTSNYKVEQTTNGKLEIHRRVLNVRADFVKVYDDTSLFNNDNLTIVVECYRENGWEQLECSTGLGVLYGGDSLMVMPIINAECIDARTYNGVVGCEIVVLGANGTEYDGEFRCVDNYDITVIKGNVTISKRVISIIKKGASKFYDRLPLVNNKIEITSGALANGHDIVVNELTLPSITKVGKIANDIPFNIKRGSIDKTSNYEINETVEDLIVAKRELMIAIFNYEKTYDGKMHEFNNRSYGRYSGSLLSGDSFDGLIDYIATDTETQEVYRGVEGGIRNAGNYKITATPEITINDVNYTHYSEYYDVSFTFGDFVILQKELYVTTTSITSNEPIYPEHTENAYNDLGALGEDDTVEIKIKGQQINKGSSLNKVEWVIISGSYYYIDGDGEYDGGNYKIIVKQGTLTYA